MADYSETQPGSRRLPPIVENTDRGVPPYNQTNTTLNVPRPANSAMLPALAAVVIVALVGLVTWSVLDDDGASVPPATETTAPEATGTTVPDTTTAPTVNETVPATPDPAADPAPAIAPEADPAPATPPADDPAATPPTPAPAP
jgi:hypothetical protein